MRFSAFKKLLSNNGRFKPDDPDFRRAYLLNVVLVFLIFYCTFYAFFNISNKVYIGTMIDAITAALDIAVFIYFHKTDNLKVCSYAIVAVVFFCHCNNNCNSRAAVLHIGLGLHFPTDDFFSVGKKAGTHNYGAYALDFDRVYINKLSAMECLGIQRLNRLSIY